MHLIREDQHITSRTRIASALDPAPGAALHVPEQRPTMG
jgi:hypothetical protein